MPTKAQLEAENEELRAKLQEHAAEAEADSALLAGEVEEEGLGEFFGDASELGPDLEVFLQEVGGGTGPEKRVEGYCYDDEKDGDGRLKFVGRWPLDRFSLQKVKDQFGGGRWVFKLKVVDSGKILASKTQSIDGKRRTQKDAGPEEDPRDFAEIMQDTHRELLEKVSEVRRGPPHDNFNPMSGALEIVTTMQGVIAPYQAALMNLLQQKETGPSFAELAAILQQGIDMGKATAPAPADPMGQVLGATLPGLLQAIQAGGPAPANPSPVEVISTAMAPNPPAAPDGPPVTRPAWDMLLSSHVPQLLKWASADAETELRAAFVVAELSPEAESMLLAELARGPDFFREFMLLHPEAKQFEPWVAEFWLAVADQYTWDTDGLPPHPFRKGEELAPEGDQDPPGGVEVGTH